MKEVSHDKGLEDPAYTEAQCDRALAEGELRQAGTGPVEESTGLLSDEDAKQINAITLMRIYDVALALLNHLDPDMAEALMEKHANGELRGPLPSLNL